MVTKEQRKKWNTNAYEKMKKDPVRWKAHLEKQRKYYKKFGRKKESPA